MGEAQKKSNELSDISLRAQWNCLKIILIPELFENQLQKPLKPNLTEQND